MCERRVAIVTGAARGMGKAIAKRLGTEKTHVVMADIASHLAESWSEILSLDRFNKGFPCKVDVADRNQVERMVDKVIQKLGRVDILVNCAGLLVEKSVMKTSEEDWDKLMRVNAKGIFLCCQMVGKVMIQQGTGKIVNIASQQAKKGEVQYAAYAASKAAVLRFTQVLALELAPYNINVNTICPGSIGTDMTKVSIKRQSSRLGINSKQYLTDYLLSIPLGRLGKAEEVAALVSFLASDEADYITGQSINITGGRITI